MSCKPNYSLQKHCIADKKKMNLDSAPTAFLAFLNAEVRSTIARAQSIFQELTCDSSFLLICQANLSVTWALHEKVKPIHSLQDSQQKKISVTPF